MNTHRMFLHVHQLLSCYAFMHRIEGDAASAEVAEAAARLFASPSLDPSAAQTLLAFRAQLPDTLAFLLERVAAGLNQGVDAELDVLLGVMLMRLRRQLQGAFEQHALDLALGPGETSAS